VEFHLERGDPRSVDGSWSLRSEGRVTVAEISIEIDFGLPRITAVFDALLRETLTDVIDGIARSAEGAARVRAGISAGGVGRPVVRDLESEAG